MANGTCGVGRRVFRSVSKRVARCATGIWSRSFTTKYLPHPDWSVIRQTPIAAPAKCASGETSCRRRRRAERRAEQHQCRVMVQKATCRWSSSSHRQTSRSSSFLSTPSCDIMHAKMTSHDSMRTISSIHCTRLAMPCRVSNQGLAFESCVWDRSWAAGNQRSSFFSSHPFSPAIRRRHGTSESEGVLQFSGELGFSRVETQAAGFIL